MKNTLTALAAVVATMAGMAGTTTALARACIRRRTVSPERHHPVHRHTAGMARSALVNIVAGLARATVEWGSGFRSRGL